jgi:hypothetical protein
MGHKHPEAAGYNSTHKLTVTDITTMSVFEVTSDG